MELVDAQEAFWGLDRSIAFAGATSGAGREEHRLGAHEVMAKSHHPWLSSAMASFADEPSGPAALLRDWHPDVREPG